MNGKHIKKCPECGSDDLRVGVAHTITLKGDGVIIWYMYCMECDWMTVTDFKREWGGSNKVGPRKEE